MKPFKITITTLALAFSASVYNMAQAEDLLDIYKEALIRDPIVLQAKAQRNASYEAISEATAALLPQIDVTGTLSRSYTSVNKQTNVKQDNDQASASANLSQALWRHSAWATRTIATKTAARENLIYNDAQQQLILRVAQAYFGVLNAVDTLNYSKANSESLKTQLEQAKRRFQVGLIAQTDMLEAQAAYDLSVTNVITAQNNLINSYEEIRKLTGRNITVLARLDANRFSPQMVTQSHDYLLNQAENNNLSLQSAIVYRDIAKDNITLAQTGHEPTLDFVGSYTTSFNDYKTQIPGSSQVNGNNHEGTIGLQLNIPIFSGGAVSSRVSQAEQNYIAAAEALENTYRTTIATFNNNYNNVKANVSSVKAYEQLTKSAGSALDATKAGYDVGTRTISDVLDATQSLYSALQNLSAARYNYIISRLNLLYSTGSLSAADIEAINKGLIK